MTQKAVVILLEFFLEKIEISLLLIKLAKFEDMNNFSFTETTFIAVYYLFAIFFNFTNRIISLDSKESTQFEISTILIYN